MSAKHRGITVIILFVLGAIFLLFGITHEYKSFTACHFESKQRNAAQGKRIRTCFEAGTYDKKSFMSDCGTILDTARKKYGDMEMTTMDSCPLDAEAKCTNVLGQGLIRFEYGRSDEYLKKRGLGCQGTGGEWQRL